MPVVQSYRPQPYSFGQNTISPITAAANQMQPQEREGIIRGAMNTTLGGLQWVGESLDKTFGARTLRGILYDGPDWGDFAHLIPFSDTLGITDPKDVVYGRDLLEKHGLLGANTPGLDWGDVAGFGVDVLADPAWLVSGPLKAVAGGATKLAQPLKWAAGKLPALQRAGIEPAESLLSAAGRLPGPWADAAKAPTFKDAYKSGDLVEKLGPHMKYAVQNRGQGLLGIHTPTLKYYDIPFSGGQKLPVPLPGVSDDPWIIFGSGPANAERFASLMSYNPLMRMWRKLREPHLEGVPVFRKEGKGGKLGFEAADISHANDLSLLRETGKTIGLTQSRLLDVYKAAAKAKNPLSVEQINELLISVGEGAWNLRGALDDTEYQEMLAQALGRTIERDGTKTTLGVVLADQYAKIIGKKGFDQSRFLEPGAYDDYVRGTAAEIITNTVRGDLSDQVALEAVMAGRLSDLAISNSSRLTGISPQVLQAATNVVEKFQIDRLVKANDNWAALPENYSKHLNHYALEPKNIINQGDLVQWEVNGAPQFDTPRKITQIVDDPTHGKWAYLEGSDAAVPLDQLTKEGGVEMYDLFRTNADGEQVLVKEALTEAAAKHEMHRAQIAEWRALPDNLKLPKSAGGSMDAFDAIEQLRREITSPGVARVDLGDEAAALADQMPRVPVMPFLVHNEVGYTWVKVDGMRDVVHRALKGSNVLDAKIMDTAAKATDGHFFKGLVDTGWLPVNKDWAERLGIHEGSELLEEVAGSWQIKGTAAEEVFNNLRVIARPKVTKDGIQLLGDDATITRLRELGKVLGLDSLKGATKGDLKIPWEEIPDGLWDNLGQAYKWSEEAGRLREVSFAKNAIEAEWMGYHGYLAKMPGGPLQASTAVADSYSILGTLVPSLVHGLGRRSPTIQKMVLDAVGNEVSSIHKLTGDHYKRLNEDFLRFLKLYSDPKSGLTGFDLLTPEIKALAAASPIEGKLSDEAEKLFRNLFILPDEPAANVVAMLEASKIPQFQALAKDLPNVYRMMRDAFDSVGIPMSELTDDWANYFFRQRNPDVDDILAKSAKIGGRKLRKQYKTVFDTASRFQRADILRHVPGGTTLGLNKIFRDWSISGIGTLDAEVVAQLSAGTPLLRLVNPDGFVRYVPAPDDVVTFGAKFGDEALDQGYLHTRGVEIEADEVASLFQPPPVITDPVAQAVYLQERYGVPEDTAKGLARFVSGMPRAIAERGIDFFGGGDPVADLSKYLQQNVKAYAAAATGRNLLLEAIRIQHFGGDLPQFGILHPGGRTPILDDAALSKFSPTRLPTREESATSGLQKRLLGDNEIASNVESIVTHREIHEGLSRGGKDRDELLSALGESLREPEATIPLAEAWKNAGYHDSKLDEFVEFANDKAFPIDKLMPGLEVARVTRDMPVPKWVAEELERVMRIYRDPAKADDVGNALLGAWDKMTTLVKGHLTIAGPFPSFHTRNGVGGLWVNWATMGTKATLEGLSKTIDMIAGAFSNNPAKRELAGELFADLRKAGATDEGTHQTSDLLGKSAQSNQFFTNVKDYVMEPWARMRRDIRESRHHNNVLRGAGVEPTAWDKVKPYAAVANPLSLRGVTEDRHSKFFFGAVGESLYRFVEVVNRAIQYYGRKSMGYSDEAAAQWTRSTHFDYSKMTGWERKGARRIVPFWGWLRNNLPLQFEMLINAPGGRSAQTIRGISSLQREGGDQWMPSWMRESFVVPTGDDEEGNRGYLTSFNALPVQDLGNFVLPSSLNDIGMAARRTAEKAVSMTHPGLKFPLEQLAGRDFFYGQNMAEMRPGPIGKATGSQLLERGVMATPASRWIRTGEELTDERTSVLAKLMNMSLALKYRKVDQEDVPRWMRSDLEKLYKEVAKDNPWLQTQTTVWVSPEDIQNLSPKVLQELAALRSLAGDIRKTKRAEEKKQRRVVVRR